MVKNDIIKNLIRNRYSIGFLDTCGIDARLKKAKSIH